MQRINVYIFSMTNITLVLGIEINNVIIQMISIGFTLTSASYSSIHSNRLTSFHYTSYSRLKLRWQRGEKCIQFHLNCFLCVSFGEGQRE